jgi:hypothetical protein
MRDIDDIEALSELSENELLQELDRLNVSIPRLEASNKEIKLFIEQSKDEGKLIFINFNFTNLFIEEIKEFSSFIEENESVIHKQNERRRVIISLLNKP